MGWSRRFAEPVPLPGGRALTTLREAGRYIASLPQRTQGEPHWQAAAEALLLVAELNGPTMMARIGMMRALNHGRPKAASGPRGKHSKAYRIIR